MTTALLVFPHQLFQIHPGLDLHPDLIAVIEDSLFFGDWHYPARFHKQKLWLHRATMTHFIDRLRRDQWPVHYCSYQCCRDSLPAQLANLPTSISHWLVVDPVDFILHRRLRQAANRLGKQITWLESPNFLNTNADNDNYRSTRNRWFQTDFYKFQRQRLGVLMDRGKPIGGRWTFDTENRLKVPRKLLNQIPGLNFHEAGSIENAARNSILAEFPNNPGSLETLFYPTTPESAAAWLKQFLDERFDQFGPYEDAMVAGQKWLWHSVLTPMLNIGLLSPQQIIDQVQLTLRQREVPMASAEGFVRQVIGWREFIRATYVDLGVTMRTRNHWQHHRALPRGFYTAETGIEPIDDVLRRVLETGYCHHIERLMVLGGFLFLCEVHPDEVYRWFMEMFVDSYDWVMVPNVYAMSQHADGGLITTKPYFSGSAYIRKQSHYSPGAWSELWDALYWRWIGNHSQELARNPRWSMMCRQWEKMPLEKRQDYLKKANDYLDGGI